MTEFERPLLIVAGAGILTAILLNLEFNLLESSLYDFRMSRGGSARASDNIVLISLDDQTARILDEPLPLPLDQHAKFLETLESFSPKAVGWLVNMNQVNQVHPEKSGWSTRFTDAAGRMEARGIPVLLGTPFDVTGEVLPPWPLSALPHSVAVIHKDGNVFAEDKVTRRALVNLYDKPAFHFDLARRLGLVPAGALPRGAFNEPQIDADYFFFRYHGDTAMVPGRAHTIPYKRYSFAEVLHGLVSKDALSGKIILVGTTTREDSGDFAFTPYSKASFTNPKLVVHANILDSIIQNNGISRAPGVLNWILTFLACAAVIGSVFSYKPLFGVFTTLSLAIGFLMVGQTLFSLKGLWIRESQALVGIFLSYYLAVPYRLIREYKKRWIYQRKNEVLVQVEELKTNFLSLVTHDLKTPVARIQGLAEVLLRKASARLIDRDRETIEHIIASTDELNRFITSILELTKVESNALQLNLESKDINQLIERSVEGFKAQSRAAHIGFVVQLEPLFPVKIDPSLMSKVINNLIDNALKYSPANSSIAIESRESGDWVEISVRDQGIGMTEEERTSLFTRFYRARNDTTTRVAGTGLGLYLTKYFVEAHHGRVEVESVKGSGSTFRIFLPIHAVTPGLKTSENISEEMPVVNNKKEERVYV